MGPLNTQTWTLQSGSSEETRALGVRLGRVLVPGDFVGLIGDLGAGKTELSRGIAEGAGVPRGEVASPTFAIVYPYQGRIPLYHADLYRLGDEDELYATGFFDLVTSGEGAFLVEWVDKISAAMPAEAIEIRIGTVDLETRRLDITARGDSAIARVSAWLSS